MGNPWRKMEVIRDRLCLHIATKSTEKNSFFGLPLTCIGAWSKCLKETHARLHPKMGCILGFQRSDGKESHFISLLFNLTLLSHSLV